MEAILTIALTIFLYVFLVGYFLYFRGFKNRKAEVMMSPEKYSQRTVYFYKNLSRTKAFILSFFIAIVVVFLFYFVFILVDILILKIM